MKKILKKLSSLVFALMIVFTTSTSISDASSNLAKMDVDSLRKRISNKSIYRLVGESTLYDKETGAEINPKTGEVKNLKDFKRLAGEPYYIKKVKKGEKNKFKEFKPGDYKNLTYKATVTSYEKKNSKKGWTISIGIKVQSVKKPSIAKTYSINISYDKSENVYYVSGSITKTKIKAVGKTQKALVTLGFTPKNQWGIATKNASSASLSAGMFDISANTNGTVTLSAGSGGGSITVGKSTTKQAFCIPIK